MKNTYALIRCWIFILSSLPFVSLHSQWQFLGSPEACHSIDFDHEEDTLVLLTSAGLFFSVDSAYSWTPISGPENVYREESIQIEKGSLYLTASKQDTIEGDSRLIHSVYRSDNWGQSWKHISSDMDPLQPLLQILIKSDTFYYIDRKNINVSYDKGDHYVPPLHNLGVYSEYYLHNHKLFGTVSLDEHELMMVSSDDGQLWDTLDGTGIQEFISDIQSINGELWKIEHYPYNHYCRMSKSVDDGQSWEVMGYIEDLLQGFFDSDPQHILGNGQDLYIITGYPSERIYHSGDGGLTWIRIAGLKGQDVYHAQDKLFFTTYEGFYFSKDHGKKLEPISNGIEAATVKNIAVTDNSQWVQVGRKVYQWNDPGSQWKELPNFEDVEATRDGHLLGLVHDTLYFYDALYSSDHGSNWNGITLGGPFPEIPLGVMCAGDVMYIRSSSYDMYYSVDNGNTWHLSDITYGYSFNYNGKYLMEISDEIHVSDNGITWTKTPKVVHPEHHFFLDFVYWSDPYYYAGSNNLLLQLHKDSTTWNKINPPFSNQPGYGLSMTSHGNTLFLSSFGAGVFTSTDHGQSWLPVNEGLNNFKTITLSVFGDDLYLGVDGGLWKRPLDEISVAIQEPAQEFCSSSKAYITDASIDVSFEQGIREMQLYSADCKLLFVKSNKDFGSEIDMSTYPSGVYYLKIISSDCQRIHRVIKL